MIEKLNWKIKELQYLFNENKTSNKPKTTGKPHCTKNPQIVRKYMSSVLNTTVKKRDNNCCFLCKSSRELEVHHIFGLGEYPFLAIYPENVVTLCHSCHKEYHSKYKEINPVTWGDFIKNKKIVHVKEVYLKPEKLVNDDRTGTIMHVIRHEPENKIAHGKLLSVMENRYGVPYYETEDDLKKLLDRKTLRDIGGEYIM